MKILYIILMFISLSLSQDRGYIFNTGSPDSTLGYLIDPDNAVANRFTIDNDYVLEAIGFFISAENIESSNITISIREDNNGIPGNLVSDLSIWEHQVNLLNQTNYNLIITTDLCIYLNKNNYYWWTIEATDDSTNATWIHSNYAFYNTATSNDGGNSWEYNLGYAGAGAIFAEQVYESDAIIGDINSDFTANVIDVVALVGYILGDANLNEEQINAADINNDNSIDIVDVVALVNLIIVPSEQSPVFILEDINPASEYYSINIGPSFFSGQVSCYYFGKQGWSTCKARFGILNDLYTELVDEGITDVKMMGINGYQYIDDSIDCMICSEECSSSTCSEGPRPLPWSQDYDDGFNCIGSNEGLCESADESGDVWDLLDATLRDFIILDRNGNEFARVNLTYNNPDPTELGECTGNYQKIKDLILAARNQ